MDNRFGHFADIRNVSNRVAQFSANLEPIKAFDIVPKARMRSCKKRTTRSFPYNQIIVTLTGMHFEAASTNMLCMAQV